MKGFLEYAQIQFVALNGADCFCSFVMTCQIFVVIKTITDLLIIQIELYQFMSQCMKEN